MTATVVSAPPGEDNFVEGFGGGGEKGIIIREFKLNTKRMLGAYVNRKEKVLLGAAKVL